MALEALPFARLCFDLETLEEADVPPYKGDLLRMALLWWLSELWCPMPTRCRHGCRRPDVCMFGRLCSPPVDPAWSPQIKRLVGDTPPPAYALWDGQDRRRRIAAGTPWQFELALFGEMALRQVPSIVAAVQEGAEQGMGRVRWRSRLRRASALRPEADENGGAIYLAEEEPHDGAPVLTWRSYTLDEIAFRYGQMVDRVAAYPDPVSSISLRFLSPVKIKERGQWVDEPRFSAIMRALVRRLRLLSQVHGDGEWPQAEYGPLLDLAETVRLEHSEVYTDGYQRRSKQSGTYEIEGLLGEAWYAGNDFRPLLPALWLGQWAHIGKNYVIGNGRYRVLVNG
ncbi:MAG: CRISPR system precrRNA processing endoribonuclease RAMP protein Cas6 [Anaerolineae bacterium]|nr:CRISPR system precrRNA processing endoribonuclease RAMP protein Cas6 [Anaerolineae bacterium]